MGPRQRPHEQHNHNTHAPGRRTSIKTHRTDVILEQRERLRIVIVTDTHGKRDARVADAVGHHDCVIHAGDIGGAAVLDQLSTKLDLYRRAQEQ